MPPRWHSASVCSASCRRCRPKRGRRRACRQHTPQRRNLNARVAWAAVGAPRWARFLSIPARPVWAAWAKPGFPKTRFLAAFRQSRSQPPPSDARSSHAGWPKSANLRYSAGPRCISPATSATHARRLVMPQRAILVSDTRMVTARAPAAARCGPGWPAARGCAAIAGSGRRRSCRNSAARAAVSSSDNFRSMHRRWGD